MAQPTKYTPTKDFSDDEANLVAGRSGVSTAGLDSELANISKSINEILTNLALIQRDDTLLANNTVHKDALDDDVLALLAAAGDPKGLWATSTAYVAKDIVSESDITYMCASDHTSGVFATDLAAGLWIALAATYSIGTITAAAQAYADAAQVSANQTAADAIATAADVVTAQAIADSIIWNDVQFKVYADSPLSIVQGDSGVIFYVDTSGGNIVVNLPLISTLTTPYTVAFKKATADANLLTVNANAADTIEGSPSHVFAAQGDGATFIPDVDPSPDQWTIAQFGSGVSKADNNTWSGNNEFGAGTGKLTRGGVEVATLNDIPAASTDVKVTSNDTTPGALLDKIVAGANITLTEVNDGANEDLQISATFALASSSVSQSKLKTSIGEVSTVSLSGALLTLPGGTYGFYPQIRATNGTDARGLIGDVNLPPGATYLTRIALSQPSDGGTAYAQQRYIQASPPYNLGFGDVPLFIFASIDTAGNIISTYVADTPPWIYNGPTQAWADEYDKDGNEFRRMRVKGAVFNNRNRNAQARAAYMQAVKDARGKYERITNTIKNADMPLIPHPFDAQPGQTIIAIDPLGSLVDKLVTMGEGGDDITELVRDYVRIGNSSVGDAGFDSSVMVVSGRFR